MDIGTLLRVFALDRLRDIGLAGPVLWRRLATQPCLYASSPRPKSRSATCSFSIMWRTIQAVSTVLGNRTGSYNGTTCSNTYCHSNAVGFQRTASNREGGRPNLNQSDFTFMLEKAQ